MAKVRKGDVVFVRYYDHFGGYDGNECIKEEVGFYEGGSEHFIYLVRERNYFDDELCHCEERQGLFRKAIIRLEVLK